MNSTCSASINTPSPAPSGYITEEIKQQWCDALRSGKYKQGKGFLCQRIEDEFSYCCLGVLCDILELYNFETIAQKGIKTEDGYNYVDYLPENILDKYIQIELATLNDSGNTFEGIANYIEQKVDTEDEV